MINLNEAHKGGSFCLSRAGLAIGDGSKLGVAIAAPNGAGIDFCINGILYHKADAATDLPLTADDAQGLLTKCLYLIVVDSDGAVTSVQGTPVLSAALTAGTSVLKWPACPANKAPIGAVKIETTGTQNFTPGTTALDAGSGANDITATYYNLFSVPSAPLTS